MAYWDTSCLVKLYVPEKDSAFFKAHVVNGATVVTSEIARLELWVTLRRKEGAGDLRVMGAREALRTYDADVIAGLVLPQLMDPAVASKFEEIIERCHGHVPPILLRTLDAIHLATAAASGELEVVATDNRLREAAAHLGFSVYPPP